MGATGDDEQKSAWNGNGRYSNGAHSKDDDPFTVSLMAEEESHKPAPPLAPLQLSAPQPLEASLGSSMSAAESASSSSSSSNKAVLNSVPAAHRPFLFLLCFVSFLVTFRPSEPFLTPYLIESKGLGADMVNERIYPTWTYCYFAFLLPAGMAGEVVGYRPMIVLQLLSLLVTYCVLIWAEGVQWMQFMQATFGFASAVQSCVFFTYIYRCSPVELYPTVVSSGGQHIRLTLQRPLQRGGG